jgi:hypothetical protein
VAERGGYSTRSFAIEPIQPPIVPLRLLCSEYLHTTAAHTRVADRSANDCAAAAAQSGAQILEVRQLAKLRRQRAVQVIPCHIPANAHARYPVVSTCPLTVPKLLHMVLLRGTRARVPHEYPMVPLHSQHRCAHREDSSTPTGARAGTARSPSRPPRPQYPRLPPSTARSILVVLDVPRSPVALPAPTPVAESGGYRKVSFVIEPIQPPIVPVNSFSLQSLHTSAAHTRGADRSANGCAAAAAQSGAQKLEVCELAELRRQLAIQNVHH